jgi:hypothetical protein
MDTAPCPCRLPFGVEAEVDGEVRQLAVAPGDELPPVGDDRVRLVDAVGVRPLARAEVDVTGDRRGVHRRGVEACGVELVDLVGDAEDRVRVDIGVVERHVHAGAVVPDDRAVDEVRPGQRVRRDVEPILQIARQRGPVREHTGVLAVQDDGVGGEGEAPQLVMRRAGGVGGGEWALRPAETAAQRLVPQRPGPQRLLEDVEIDPPGDVEGRAEPGRYEQAVLAHGSRGSDVGLLYVRGWAGVLRQVGHAFDGRRMQGPGHEPSGPDLATVDIGQIARDFSVRMRVTGLLDPAR